MSQKNYPELITEIPAAIYTNTIRAISGDDIANILLDIVDSVPIISGIPITGDILEFHGPSNCWIPVVAGSGGGDSVGGSNTQIQVNVAGSFGGYSTFTLTNNGTLLNVPSGNFSQRILIGASGIIDASGNMGLGTQNINSKAILELKSTQYGFLKPRMSATQRNSMGSVTQGMEIYNTSISQPEYYNGSKWVSVSGTPTKLVNDSSLIIVDANTYKIFDSTGAESIRFNQRGLIGPAPDSQLLLDWSLAQLNDLGGDGISIDWDERKLYANDGSTVMLDYSNGILKFNNRNPHTFFNTLIDIDSPANDRISFYDKSLGSGNWLTASGSLDIGGATLQLVGDNAAPGASYYYGTNSTGIKSFYALNSGVITAIGNGTGYLYNAASGDLFYNSAGNPVVYLLGMQLKDNASITAIDWDSRLFLDSAGSGSLDADTRILYDVPGQLSIDYGNRTLNNSTGSAVLSWNNGGFNGILGDTTPASGEMTTLLLNNIKARTSINGIIGTIPNSGEFTTILLNTLNARTGINSILGNVTPNSGELTTVLLNSLTARTSITSKGQITSTVITGTAPLVVASTTNIANLNSSTLNGNTFANPGVIGGTTPASGEFISLLGDSYRARLGFTGVLGYITPNSGEMTSLLLNSLTARTSITASGQINAASIKIGGLTQLETNAAIELFQNGAGMSRITLGDINGGLERKIYTMRWDGANTANWQFLNELTSNAPLQIGTGDQIFMSNLPTNYPGSATQLWNQNGFLSIGAFTPASGEFTSVLLNNQALRTGLIVGANSVAALNSKALFEVDSTTKGAIPVPKMTNTQRNAISSPPEGLMIYNTTNHMPEWFNATNWVGTSGAGGGGTVTQIEDGSSHVVVDGTTQQLKDAGGAITIKWADHILYDDNNAVNAVDWTGNTLVNASNVMSVDWANYILQDGAGQSIDWTNRQLKDVNGITALDWSNGILGGSQVLFDHNSDVSTTHTNGTEDDLYTDTLIADQLHNNNDKIVAEYAGTFVQSATATRTLRVYFGGTKIYDSGALTVNVASAAWYIEVFIIRVDAATVRCSVLLNVDGLAFTSPVAYLSVGSLTLTNTQVLKIAAIAASTGAASGDIVAKLGYVEYKRSAL